MVGSAVDDGSLSVPSPGQARFAALSEAAWMYAASIAAALLVAGALVAATGGSIADVAVALLDGSVRRPGRWGLTLGIATPLLLVALGTIVSSRAGLVNIGQEGQLLIGAAAATYVGMRVEGPTIVTISLIAVSGVVGGALWAAIAGALKYRRGVPEVLSTLLMVSIAAPVVGFGLRRESVLLGDPELRANRTLASDPLPEGNRIPRFEMFGNDMPVSVLVALAAAAITAFVLSSTVPGFRLRMLGQNERTAQRAGVDPARYGMTAMCISGGLAGLGGAAMLASGDFGNFQLTPGFSANIGWTGLLIALVARERALVAVLVAFVFASLRSGSGFLAATGVERTITDVVQALIVLALLVPPAAVYFKARRRALRTTRERV